MYIAERRREASNKRSQIYVIATGLAARMLNALSTGYWAMRKERAKPATQLPVGNCLQLTFATLRTQSHSLYQAQ